VIRVRSLCILLVVGLTAAGSAAGAVNVVLQIDEVPGSSTLEGYRGAIDVLSFSWGASNPGASRGSGAGASRPEFSEINFMKLMDSASPALLQALTTGRVFAKATVTLLVPTGGSMIASSTIELRGVSVTSQQLSGSSETPTESISLRFDQVKWEVCSSDDTGAPAGCQTVTWNVAKNTP